MTNREKDEVEKVEGLEEDEQRSVDVKKASDLVVGRCENRQAVAMSLGFEPLCTRFQNASPIYRGARGEKPAQTVLGDRPQFSCRPFHML